MLIGTDCVCIRYYPLGFKRIIPNERIFAAEIVSQNHQYYILLTLDGCPQFKNSNTRYPEWYKFKHFRKVVLIQCEQKVAFACKAYFDTNNVRTDVILKQPWGPKNGPIIPT